MSTSPVLHIRHKRLYDGVVGLSVTWQISVISNIKIIYVIIESVLTNNAGDMVVGFIQREAWYLTMLEPLSYSYRGFFPFAENTGCTPSAWHQPDCEGILREIRFQEISHSLLINLGHFIKHFMTPSTTSLPKLIYSSWFTPRSVFKHG